MATGLTGPGNETLFFFTLVAKKKKKRPSETILRCFASPSSMDCYFSRDKQQPYRCVFFPPTGPTSRWPSRDSLCEILSQTRCQIDGLTPLQEKTHPDACPERQRLSSKQFNWQFATARFGGGRPGFAQQVGVGFQWGGGRGCGNTAGGGEQSHQVEGN